VFPLVDDVVDGAVENLSPPQPVASKQVNPTTV
jgi:hypothetical protein